MFFNVINNFKHLEIILHILDLLNLTLYRSILPFILDQSLSYSGSKEYENKFHSTLPYSIYIFDYQLQSHLFWVPMYTGRTLYSRV